MLSEKRINEVKNILVNTLGEDMVHVSCVTKNNNTSLTGISIGNSKVRPVFYVENFDDSLIPEDIAEEIIKQYNESQALEVGIEIFENKELLLSKVYPRVINALYNADDLNNMPHRIVAHDLAIIYTVEVVENGVTKITNAIVDSCGITEGELYLESIHNIMRHNTPIDLNMMQVLADMCDCTVEEMLDMFGDDENNTTQIVITNEEKHFGAVSIFVPEFLRKMHEKYGNFVMLPSSTHEVLLIPTPDKPDDMDSMHKMVKEVNQEAVNKTEWLSDHAYYYDGMWHI